MGRAVKKRSMRKLIRKDNLDFICIQETKLDHIELSLCASLWVGSDIDWVFQPSTGNSGGLLCIWRKDRFQKNSSFSGQDGGGLLCPFCKDDLESAFHLFSSCKVTYSVWQSIYNWLNITVTLPQNPFHHYLNHLGLVNANKGWKAWSIIWFATVWAIWRHRNDIIFNKTSLSIHHILDNAKMIVPPGKSVKKVKRHSDNKLVDNPLDLDVLPVPLVSCATTITIENY
ncbi:hypothetical protein Lal_00025934 [Lupinus albus]|nr:hypothetical protein Lal_00025934 [Lupinus albus]